MQRLGIIYPERTIPLDKSRGIAVEFKKRNDSTARTERSLTDFAAVWYNPDENVRKKTVQTGSRGE